jgi:ABC-type multidrug transport system permease subunit
VIYHVPSCLFVFFFLYYVFLHRASPFRFLLVPSLVLPPLIFTSNIFPEKYSIRAS